MQPPGLIDIESSKGVAFSHGVVTITANLYIGLFAALVGDSESMRGWVFLGDAKDL